jgi:GAF domain-containing protein
LAESVAFDAGWGTVERGSPELIESVNALGMIVFADETFESTTGLIAEAARLANPGTDACSISLVEGTSIRSLGATSSIAVVVDRLQEESGEGPYLSAISEHATFYIPDTSQDETWPRFSKGVYQETRIRALLSYVLAVGDDVRGALNLFSFREDPFDPTARAGGALLAAHVGVALANAQSHESQGARVAELTEGMKTRSVIGQALGLLMADQGIDPDEAFAILLRFSQAHNVKIRTIAERLVANRKAGGLPTEGPSDKL